jgi:thiamine pyrophosphate-dependent acetolactate synthase large subunit-like protein
LALGKCDCLLVVGSRLDVRQTGSDAEVFGQGKKIFHVDCETAEMNNRVRGCRTLLADVGQFLAGAIAHFENHSETMRPAAAWICNRLMTRNWRPFQASIPIA